MRTLEQMLEDYGAKPGPPKAFELAHTHAVEAAQATELAHALVLGAAQARSRVSQLAAKVDDAEANRAQTTVNRRIPGVLLDTRTPRELRTKDTPTPQDTCTTIQKRLTYAAIVQAGDHKLDRQLGSRPSPSINPVTITDVHRQVTIVDGKRTEATRRREPQMESARSPPPLSTRGQRGGDHGARGASRRGSRVVANFSTNYRPRNGFAARATEPWRPHNASGEYEVDGWQNTVNRDAIAPIPEHPSMLAARTKPLAEAADNTEEEPEPEPLTSGILINLGDDDDDDDDNDDDNDDDDKSFDSEVGGAAVDSENPDDDLWVFDHVEEEKLIDF